MPISAPNFAAVVALVTGMAVGPAMPAAEEAPQRLAFGSQTFGGSLPNPEHDKRRAEFYIEEGAFKEAARRLERAARYDPSDPEIFRRLGYVYRQLEKPAKAVDALKRAVDLVPEDYASWQALGEAQLATGDGAGARESLVSLKARCGGCAESSALEASIAEGAVP